MPGAGEPLDRALSRRRLLHLAAGGAGAIIVGCKGASDAPTASPSTPTPPTARELGFDTDLPLTANDAFYVMKRGLVPDTDAASHVLTIDGLVARPLELGLDDLRALPQHTVMRTLECIGNAPDGELIGNAVWTGARFADVLALAEPDPAGAELVLRAADGYHTGVATELATDPESYLVWSMNGAPLPPEHGDPLRCLFPGRYGQKQPKWLTSITVQREHHLGYYERQGWSDQARIVTKSRLDAPAKRQTVRPPVTVRGIAFADESGIAAVEVLVDDEPAGEATFLQAPPPYANLCWTVWTWTWPAHLATPGRHTLSARATDGRGHSQSRGRRALLGGEAKEGRGEMHEVPVVVEG